MAVCLLLIFDFQQYIAFFKTEKSVSLSSKSLKTKVASTGSVSNGACESHKTGLCDRAHSPLSPLKKFGLMSENSVFWRHQAAFDNSIRLLVNHYENSASARLAIRPYGSWWIDEYIWLLKHIQSLGYEFKDFNEYKGGVPPKNTVYVRYDIHLRDISPLFVILDTNYVYGFPSVSFINWDFERRNKDRRDDYRLIRKFDDPLHSYALHGSPISTAVGRNLPNDTAVPWIRNGQMKTFFQKMLVNDKNGTEQRKLREEAGNEMHKIARSFEVEFPNVHLFSYHGSAFDRSIKRYCAEDPDFCRFNDLKSPNMRNIIQKALGKEWVIVDEQQLDTVTDSSTSIDVLCKIDALSTKEKGFSLLIHPAQMLRNRRMYSEQGIVFGEPASEGVC